jgi:hypothetical protein
MHSELRNLCILEKKNGREVAADFRPKKAKYGHRGRIRPRMATLSTAVHAVPQHSARTTYLSASKRSSNRRCRPSTAGYVSDALSCCVRAVRWVCTKKGGIRAGASRYRSNDFSRAACTSRAACGPRRFAHQTALRHNTNDASVHPHLRCSGSCAPLGSSAQAHSTLCKGNQPGAPQPLQATSTVLPWWCAGWRGCRAGRDARAVPRPRSATPRAGARGPSSIACTDNGGAARRCPALPKNSREALYVLAAHAPTQKPCRTATPDRTAGVTPAACWERRCGSSTTSGQATTRG